MSRERSVRKRSFAYQDQDDWEDLTSDPCPSGLASEHVETVHKFHPATERKLREIEAKMKRDLALLKWGGLLALAVLVVAAIVAWVSLALQATQAVKIVLVYATPLIVGIISAIGKHWIRRL